MSYMSQFPEGKYTVPEFLFSNNWVDVSWGNDACPRFENEELRLAVWVDADIQDNREFDDWKKFTVIELIVNKQDGNELGETTLFDTEDANALDEWLTLYESKQSLEDTIAVMNTIDREHLRDIKDELVTTLARMDEAMANLT